MQKRSPAMLLACAMAFVTVTGVGSQASALSGVESILLGDQTAFFNAPGQEWTFTNRLGEHGNHAFLQLMPGPYTVMGHAQVLAFPGVVPLSGGNLYNINPAQAGNGGGLVLELMNDLTVGLWVSQYAPALGGFMGRAVTATGWATIAGNDIAGRDLTAGIGAMPPPSRKVDVFASYKLAELLLGLHLWYGSSSTGAVPDDSTGPVDIDDDSDTATGTNGFEQSLDVEDSTAALTDFGISVSGGFDGIENLTTDVGVDINALGISSEPNGLSDFVDAGGFGFGISARALYALTDMFHVGAFVRFTNQSLSMTPTLNRDGGLLRDVVVTESSATPSPTATPGGVVSTAGAPGGDGALNDNTPVTGTTYTETDRRLQVAALLKVVPVSRVMLFGSLGFDTLHAANRVEIGDEWYQEVSADLTAMPFIHMGVQGGVTDWFTLFMGATKRWERWTRSAEAFDSRIPDDNFYFDPGGGQNNTPTAGNEANTNANRREQTASNYTDTSAAQLMLGFKMMWNGLHFTGHLNPLFLLNGPQFITGNATGPFVFGMNLSYNWGGDGDAVASAPSARPAATSAPEPLYSSADEEDSSTLLAEPSDDDY